MSMITGLTRGGVEYIPEFVMEINQANCIGCGRCFKVCSRDVFDLVERSDVLEMDDYDDDYDDDDDDGFSDDTAMVMSLKDAMDCIGCGSCARICPKKCFSHEAKAA
jgi:Nif-specific ferredoxin III